ncbi:AAA-domain-containing protein [Bimuria novae-zelandiae CBS 107.79]|uniref:AAA-domain-containing protein n=1 Tax=Bimuria novae-zelandiae CBS 107.79 TaxID=1447943 RepID=A0A6A5VNC9_9PLEO|nr:AAA-domain-containing protein [Bimuria novae-zelandiae CBS 107.79]
MTAATSFTLRPLERTSSSLDPTSFRVHLSAKELKNLGLTAGDRIRLTSPRGFHGYALAWLAQQTNPGNKPIAKVSDLLREKYDLVLTDAVVIEKVLEAPKPVTSVEVTFSQTSDALRKYSSTEQLVSWTKYALAQLELLVPGCTFDVEKTPKSLGSGSKVRMTVTKVDPDVDSKHPLFFSLGDSGVVFPNGPSLSASVATKSSGTLRLDGAGIGGLSNHLHTINRRLTSISSSTIPRSNPRLLGPLSFLLHGAEGCGKTLLLKRLSEASWRRVYRLDQQWLAANRKDLAEALSEEVFDSALDLENQPSLILIDDLDKFLRKAESLVSQMQDELAKLQNTKVVVATATRSLYDIDASLRSPSCFGGIQLELSAPNVKQREDVFRQVIGPDLERTKLDLVLLAERCHGFVGRDIKDLCLLARQHRVEQIEDNVGNESETPVDEALEQVDFVTMEDFEAVAGQVQPSVLKDSIIEVPKVHWTDIAGVDHVRSLLESIVVRPYKFPDLDAEFGAPQSRKGVLLYGPPGCAKTLIAQAVATESRQNFLAVKGSELIKMYVGESERAVRDVFRRARAAKPCIIFFDEIDSIGKSRDKMPESGLNVVATLLNEMDGIEALKDVFIIGATNRPDILDAALIRVGRFDVHIHIGLPTLEARKQILQIHTRKWPLAADVEMDVLASKTEGSTGADIKGLCANVVELAKSEYLASHMEGTAEVRMSQFEKALEEHVPRTLPEEAARYEGWRPGKSLVED